MNQSTIDRCHKYLKNYTCTLLSYTKRLRLLQDKEIRFFYAKILCIVDESFRDRANDHKNCQLDQRNERETKTCVAVTNQM